jgi:GcrA cell cycle regulator
MSWTDERVALLKKLWGEGKSAAEIAKVLGGGLTRNAVIGKAHRLKLSNRISPIQQNNKKPAPSVKIVEEKKVSVASKVIKNKGVGVKMVQLKERMCRWPHGDPQEPDFFFCGDENVPGLPYCVEHAKAAYQTSSRTRVLTPEEFERPPSPEYEDEMKEAAVSA